ncbi:hypothetical protein EON62_05185, partial [archaeon]
MCRKVGFESAAFTTEQADSNGYFVDEELLFEIDHYYGAAPLTFTLYERGLLTKSAVGSGVVTAGEILHAQLRRFSELGMSIMSDTTGKLAVDNRCSDLMASASLKTNPKFLAWSAPGKNPCLLTMEVPLKGGALQLEIQTEFMLSHTNKPCGPLGMSPVHRAAAG